MNKIALKAIEVTKRYFFLMALSGMVIGFSAFKISQPEIQNHFWYDLQGNSISDGAQPNPEAACASSGEGCAVGYIDEPLDPTDGEHNTTRGLIFR